MVHHCHGQGGADVDYDVAGCCSAYLEGGSRQLDPIRKQFTGNYYYRVVHLNRPGGIKCGPFLSALFHRERLVLINDFVHRIIGNTN